MAFLGWMVVASGYWRYDPSLPWEVGLDTVLLVLLPVGAPAVALLVARKP